MFENVSGLLSMDGGRLFPQIQREFGELGYTLKYQVMDAVTFFSKKALFFFYFL